jgi:hypothetical protein
VGHAAFSKIEDQLQVNPEDGCFVGGIDAEPDH